MDTFIEEIIKEIQISQRLFQRQQEIQQQSELLESLTQLIFHSLSSTPTSLKKDEIDLTKEE